MQNEVADSPPGDATLTEDLDRFKKARLVLETWAELATVDGVELQDGRMIRGATVRLMRTSMCSSAVSSHVSDPMNI
jgi:hypothetical protein